MRRLFRGSSPFPWPVLLVPLAASAWARELWAPDEPRYAQVAKEMWDRGSFVVLHLCGSVYPDKPPLFYWLASLLGVASGWSEFAMRLVSIAATGGSAWLVAGLARRWFGAAEAAWAPCLYLAFALVSDLGGRLQLDPLLAFFCLASLNALSSPAPDAARAGRRVVLAGAAAGLGALTKGPVAFVHVLLPWIGWRLAGVLPTRVGGGATTPARATARARGLAVLLALAPVLVWATAVVALEPALFRDLFFGQHLERAVDGSRHGGPPWKHLGRMPLMLLPWTLPVLLGLVDAVRSWRAHRAGRPWDPGLVRAGIWLGVLFAFFSAIPSKRDLYLLPAYPAAALLGARWIAFRLPDRPLSRWVAWLPVALLGLGGGAALAAPFVLPRLALEGLELDGTLPLALGLGAVFGAGAWLAGRAARRRAWTSWGGAVLGTWTVVATVVALGVYPRGNGVKSARELAEWLAGRPERPLEIPCRGVRAEGYRFYGGVPAVNDDALVRALERDGGDFLGLVRDREWERMSDDERARMSILTSRRVGSRLVHVVGTAVR